jgi:uncharacterized protein YdhG (YjbR/CyaY superfamily)
MKNKQIPISSIDEYIATFPADTQEILKKLRSTIKDAAPDAAEKISYGMPTFTMNGKYLIYFAGWKNHVSIYPVPSGDQEFNKKIEHYISGKGTLKFPLDQPLPLDLVSEMVRLQITSNLKQTEIQSNFIGEK